MPETAPPVTILMVAANCGDAVRNTLPGLEAAMAGVPHEVVVVDHQCNDGSCRGLPRDVLIVRAERRETEAAARHLGVRQSRGEILIWCDPPVECPPQSLRYLAKLASYKEAVVQFRSGEARGGRLEATEGGLVAVPAAEAAPLPALHGGVYGMKRSVYDRLKGWPELPAGGAWLEEAMTLWCWFSGVPIVVDEAYACRREPPPAAEGAEVNVPYGHALFFPKSYETFWRPRVETPAGREALASRTFQQQKRAVSRASVLTEAAFFRLFLDLPWPPDSEGERYLQQQSRRSRPGEWTAVRPRVERALRWMFERLPDGVKGRRVLDLGSRDGYALDLLRQFGAEAQGVELVPATARYARGQGRPVQVGDMQALPFRDATWDLVTSLHSLEHCPDARAAAGEMVRVLKPGGWLMVAVPREKPPSRDYAHNTAFAGLDDLRRLFLENPAVVPTSLQADEERGELRLLAQKGSTAPAGERVASDEMAALAARLLLPEGKALARRFFGRDPEGTAWRVDPRSGEWRRRGPSSWVPADPPPSLWLDPDLLREVRALPEPEPQDRVPAPATAPRPPEPPPPPAPAKAPPQAAQAPPAAAERRCPGCGKPGLPGKAFCTWCGTKLG